MRDADAPDVKPSVPASDNGHMKPVPGAPSHAVTAALGRRVVEGTSVPRLLQDGAEAVFETLGVDRVAVQQLDDVSGYLLLTAGVGWSKEVIRRTRLPITKERRESFVAMARGPEILDDVSKRVPDGPLLASAGFASMISALIGGRESPYGTLHAVSFSPRRFTPEEGEFVQSIANTLWGAIERSEADEAYRQAALYDETTGLPNRRLLIERLRQALERARAESCAAAVLLIDLDNFKVINDSLGNRGGDAVLRAIAPRLRAVARECDTVARLGSDEFAIVCEGIISAEQVLDLAHRVGAELRLPFEIAKRRHVVHASIGVVLDAGCGSPSSLLRDADTAMHRAKERGGGCVELFSRAIRKRVVERMQRESELYRALEHEELCLHYQPFFTVPDRRLLGMEALVRWQHPQRGLLAPGEFIPLAEETGLIVDLGTWVLTTAVRTLAGWRASGYADDELMLSVNVSPRQLRPVEDQPDLLDVLAGVLERSGLPPRSLALEITESMVMDAGGQPELVLLGLRRLGVQTMLDDFGTGHSSLGRLSEVPLDVVKIDRCFIDGLGRNRNREPIVAAIIAMAEALGLRVIAEGVETDEEWDCLLEMGCGAAQGFGLARPMPPEQLVGLLEGTSLRPSAAPLGGAAKRPPSRRRGGAPSARGARVSSSQ